MNEKCPFCEALKVGSKTQITKHHIIPLRLSKKFLGEKMDAKIALCEVHHKIFNELTSPFYYLLLSDLESDRLTSWFKNHKLPRIIKKIKILVDGENACLHIGV